MSTGKADTEQISISNDAMATRPAPPPPSRIANPVPTGTFSFAATTFLLSMYNVNTRGIHTPNVVVGMAVFTGGLLQFIAGMWEYPRGNVFGATVFSSYGTFWMSYATILIPGSGIISAYSDQQEFNNALGLYLIVWMMITIIFLVVSLQKNLSFIILFTTLSLALGLLAGGSFTGMAKLTKAGGVVGIVTALVAYYVGSSEILEAEARPVVRLPLGIF